jgi:CheY-like chemotaxis protein
VPERALAAAAAVAGVPDWSPCVEEGIRVRSEAQGEAAVRVLIIEDDRDTREMFTVALELEGHEVASATNGAEGLTAALEARPDVIVLDLMMPVMNGWQFRAEQRQQPSIADVPVVVVSAFGQSPELDVAECLSKPCDVDAILGAVLRHGSARHVTA